MVAHNDLRVMDKPMEIWVAGGTSCSGYCIFLAMKVHETMKSATVYQAAVGNGLSIPSRKMCK